MAGLWGMVVTTTASTTCRDCDRGKAQRCVFWAAEVERQQNCAGDIRVERAGDAVVIYSASGPQELF